MSCWEKYIVLSSNDHSDFFPQNKQNNFSYLIDPPLELKGTWTIGLSDILVEFDNFKDTDIKQPGGGHIVLDIFLEQTSGTIFNGRESTLLCQVTFNVRNRLCKTVHVHYDNPHMTLLKSPTLDRLDVVIKVASPENLSFEEGSSTRATLVLRKVH